MNDGSSVKKLLNFFVKFREACKKKNYNHRLIDILMEAFLCDNENDVFLIYPVLLNQSKFAFDYLMQNTNHDKQDLDEVKSYIESSIKQSRQELYVALSEKTKILKTILSI